MKNIIMASLLTVLAASAAAAFNIDPKASELSLKSGEKKEVVVRVKNVFNFAVAVNTAVSADKNGTNWITKVIPAKTKLEPGAYTYANAYIAVPEKASGAAKQEILFQVSGTGKNAKFSQNVTMPVSITVRNTDKNDAKPVQAKPVK